MRGYMREDTVGTRWMNFGIQAQLSAGWNWLRDLKTDLLTSKLSVPEIDYSHPESRFNMPGHRLSPSPVGLLQIIGSLPNIGSHTAVLGLDHDDRPLLFNLLAPDVTNILIAGKNGAGKSGLLRTLALSLALTNRQSNIQLVIFDGPISPSQPFSSLLYPLSYLPHMMFPIVESVEEAAETLRFLVSEVDYRQREPVADPLIVVLLDNVDRLVVEGGESIRELLIYLLQEGPECGMRLVMAAENPAVPELRPLLIGHVPVRLVGQVVDSRMARQASGRVDSQAEYLKGRGDFLAVASGSMVSFQAAHVSDYDLHLSLERLYEQSRAVSILAQPLSIVSQQVPTGGQKVEVQSPDLPQVHDPTARIEVTHSEPDAVHELARETEQGSFHDLNTATDDDIQASGKLHSQLAPEHEPEGNETEAAKHDVTGRPSSWSDAFFDYLNTAEFGSVPPAPEESRTEGVARTVDSEQEAVRSTPDHHEWDDSWYEDKFWVAEEEANEVASRQSPSGDEEPAELIYEDIEDDFGLLEEEETRVRNVDEEE